MGVFLIPFLNTGGEKLVSVSRKIFTPEKLEVQIGKYNLYHVALINKNGKVYLFFIGSTRIIVFLCQVIFIHWGHSLKSLLNIALIFWLTWSCRLMVTLIEIKMLKKCVSCTLFLIYIENYTHTLKAQWDEWNIITWKIDPVSHHMYTQEKQEYIK